LDLLSPGRTAGCAGRRFAVPSNTVKLIADQLIRSGKVTRSGRAYLGVSVISDRVVVVVSVVPNGTAAKAGIRPGDRIVAVKKTHVANTDELATVLAQIKPGQTIPVEIVRGGQTLTVQVTGRVPATWREDRSPAGRPARGCRCPVSA
jgi:S1-C subfamily serine protease